MQVSFKEFDDVWCVCVLMHAVERALKKREIIVDGAESEES